MNCFEWHSLENKAETASWLIIAERATYTEFWQWQSFALLSLNLNLSVFVEEMSTQNYSLPQFY